MEWVFNRHNHEKEIVALKEGDKVRLRTDIDEHESEIACGHVSCHNKMAGEEVTIKCITGDCCSEKYYKAFKIEEDEHGWIFDTDMIDFTNMNVPKGALLNWMENYK